VQITPATDIPLRAAYTHSVLSTSNAALGRRTSRVVRPNSVWRARPVARSRYSKSTRGTLSRPADIV